MKVNIHETAVIRPQKPPFHRDHVLSLSHIDTDPNLLVFLRYFRVYTSNPDQQAEPFHVITAALSAALVHYYPLAGTLCRRHCDGRLELHYHIDDGVPVVKASVKSTLINADIEEKLSEQLVPYPDPNEGLIRPILLQVTSFGCGGFVFGAAVHHAICDGIGASLFFNALAELARGAARISTEPVWYRTNLLGPRNPARVEFPVQEFLSLDKDCSPYLKRVIKECFHVNEECLDRIKGFLVEQSGLKITTFEALGAFIWRARTISDGILGDEKVTFAYSINIRKLVNPPLPDGYWGNGCVPLYVHLQARQLVEQPIWKTIESIRKSKYNTTDEYVRSFIDFQELYYFQGIKPGRRLSGFTDWRHMGQSKMDFGWGGPVSMVSLPLNGSLEPCFFLPGKEEGHIKVVLHLEEDSVGAFRQEMDKLKIHKYRYIHSPL